MVGMAIFERSKTKFSTEFSYRQVLIHAPEPAGWHVSKRTALLLAPDAPHSRLVSAFKEVVRGVIESELDHIRPCRG
jgi:hypothetical protein